MDMDVKLQNMMGMSKDMSITFENKYSCNYGETCPIHVLLLLVKGEFTLTVLLLLLKKRTKDTTLK